MQNELLSNILTIVSFVFFTGLVALGTWWLTRKDRRDTNEGYFLGGRSLTGGYIAGSLLLTNLSTEQLVGLNSDAYVQGLSVMAWEVIAAAALVIMALVFLPRFLRSGIATLPQLLEERFGSSTQTISTFIFVIAYAVILLPIVLSTGASGLIGILDLSRVTGIDQDTNYQILGLSSLVGDVTGRQILVWSVIWFIGIIGSIYAVVGGLRAVAVSDTLMGFGLLIGGVLITVLGLYAVNDNGIFAAFEEMRVAAQEEARQAAPEEMLQATPEESREKLPDRWNSLGENDEPVSWDTLLTGVLLINLFYWCTNQQIIQRTFGASNLAEGQKGVLLAGFFKSLTPLILVVPGMIAYHLYAENVSLSADQIDRVYGMLVQDVLPWYLTGFFAAVVVGAILSSFNSALNSTATLFSLGIYKKLIRPLAADHEVIGSGKWFGWMIAIVAMTIAPFLDGQKSIFGYLQSMNGLYFIPLFAVVVVGFVFRRVPTWAANAALIFGPIVIGVCYLIAPLSEWLGDKQDWDRIAYVMTYPAGMLTTIGDYHLLGIVFVLLVGMMVVWGMIAPRDEPWEQRDSGEVDMTPWPWAVPVGIVLLILVGTIYWSFADFSVVKNPYAVMVGGG